jgi:hypothetical protein
MIVPLQLALKTHTNLGCAASFATLDTLVGKFTLPPAALPIGDASLTHVIKLAAHSTTSPTPTAMKQSFIMTPYYVDIKCICYQVYFLYRLIKATLVTFCKMVEVYFLNNLSLCQFRSLGHRAVINPFSLFTELPS